MKTIHTYWRQWLHLENLIQKRRTTFRDTLLMSDADIEKNLKREFSDEYPHTYETFIVDSFFQAVGHTIDCDLVKIEQNDNVFSIGFFENKQSLVATVVVSVNLDPDNGVSIFSVVNDLKITEVNDDYNAHDFFNLLTIK